MTLCDPMDCSMSGSSVHETFQVKILEWVDFPPPGIEPRSPESLALAVDSSALHRLEASKVNERCSELTALVADARLRCSLLPQRETCVSVARSLQSLSPKELLQLL